jgi:benzoylformate decarboxylase
MIRPLASGLRRGAEVLLEVLASEGVEYIFGNPGTTELPLMDALTDQESIAYILALQESSAVAMADGYAQAAGKPGFLNLHTAGGLGHGMGNLLNASVSQTPLVVTAGQQDARHTISDPLLHGDLVSLARPAVKWAQEVATPEQIPVLVRRAFHDCNAAPRGPVFLSLPMNVMEEESAAPIGRRSHIAHNAVAGDLDLLAVRLADVPPGKLAVIAGDEVHGSDAAEEVVAIAELLGAPVFGSSWPSRIPFPTAHPLWAGNLPTRASEIAQRLSGYQAILALGGKSLITILYSEASALPTACELFQISADVRDLGRTYPTGLSTVGDIRSSLLALAPLIAKELHERRDSRDALITAARALRDKQRKELLSRADAQLYVEPIAPLVAARECLRVIGNDVPIVDEAIATAGHVRSLLSSASSHQYSFLRGGALGWGMPAAVGASLGLGRQPVVSFVGDGAALYSPQALWTAAHERLPVTFIVMNNTEYNVLKNFLRAQTGYSVSRHGRMIAMDLNDPPVDYQALAQSFGVKARVVTKAAEIAPAVEEAIGSGEPRLVEIRIGT